MYNFRARARAVLPGAVPAQGMRVRAVPAVSSPISPSQATEMLEQDVETVPETEMSGRSVERNATGKRIAEC